MVKLYSMSKDLKSIDGMLVKRPVPKNNSQKKRVLSSVPVSKNQKLSLEKKEARPVIGSEISLEGTLDGFVDSPARGKKNKQDSRHDKKLTKKLAKKEKRKKHRARRIVMIVLLVLLAGLLAIVVLFVQKIANTSGSIFGGSVIDIFTSHEKLKQDENGRTNILIFGTSGYGIDDTQHDGGLLTDSIMVLSIDQNAKNAYMISLPRDLYIKHTCPALGTSAGKLNETYYCVYKSIKQKNDEEAAAGYFREVAGEILGLDVQYYVHPDWTALVQAVDAVGGVDVMIESSDSRGIYDVAAGIKYPNGIAHLGGEKALALARARGSYGGYGLPNSNFDREKNQQRILAALQQKAMSAGVLTDLPAVYKLIDSLGNNNLRTNFQTNEVQTLVELARSVKTEDIISLPLVDGAEGLYLFKTDNVNGQSVVVPSKGLYNYSEIQKYLKTNMNSNPVVREAAVIDVLNGSEISGLAAEEAAKLDAEGYTVGGTYNAPTGENYPKVTVYQVSDSNPETAKALERRYGVNVRKDVPVGINVSKIDFVIVLGPEFGE